MPDGRAAHCSVRWHRRFPDAPHLDPYADGLHPGFSRMSGRSPKRQRAVGRLSAAARLCRCRRGGAGSAIILWGEERYRCLGFALFSGGYLALALSSLQPQLSTTHLLAYIHARVTSFSGLNFEVSRFDQNSVVYRVVFSDGVRVKNIADSVVNSTSTENLLASMAPANGWRLAFPGATNRDQFERVGHSLFALLAGLLGAAIATWFHVICKARGNDRKLKNERDGNRDVASLSRSTRHRHVGAATTTDGSPAPSRTIGLSKSSRIMRMTKATMNDSQPEPF